MLYFPRRTTRRQSFAKSMYWNPLFFFGLWRFSGRAHICFSKQRVRHWIFSEHSSWRHYAEGDGRAATTRPRDCCDLWLLWFVPKTLPTRGSISQAGWFIFWLFGFIHSAHSPTLTIIFLLLLHNTVAPWWHMGRCVHVWSGNTGCALPLCIMSLQNPHEFALCESTKSLSRSLASCGACVFLLVYGMLGCSGAIWKGEEGHHSAPEISQENYFFTTGTWLVLVDAHLFILFLCGL